MSRLLSQTNPDPKEQLQLGFSLPNGIGIIGIYHSHPADSNIFHSHIDTDTVLDITNIVPNFTSIVTNGTDIQCLMLVDKDSQALKKVVPKLKVPVLPPSSHFRTDVNLLFPSGEDEVDAPVIMSKIAHIFNMEWDQRSFFALGSKKVLATNVPLNKIPENSRTGARVITIDLPPLKSGQAEQRRVGIRLQGTIEVEIFHRKGNSIEEIDTMVQNALRDLLTQQIFKGCLNDAASSWELVPTHTVHFWDVPLTVIFSRGHEQEEVQNYLDAWIQRLGYISPQLIEKDAKLKLQLNLTFADLGKLTKQYRLSDQEIQIRQKSKDFHT